MLMQCCFASSSLLCGTFAQAAVGGARQARFVQQTMTCCGLSCVTRLEDENNYKDALQYIASLDFADVRPVACFLLAHPSLLNFWDCNRRCLWQHAFSWVAWLTLLARLSSV